MGRRPRLLQLSYPPDNWWAPFVLGSAGAAQCHDVDLVVYSPMDAPGRLATTFDGCMRLVGNQHPALPRFQRFFTSAMVDIRLSDGSCSGVRIDSAGAVRSAMEHLLAHGHRRIGYLACVGPDTPDTLNEKELRLQSFRDALIALDLSADERFIASVTCTSASDPSEAETVCGRQGMARLLDAGLQITAIVAYNDAVALGALQELDFRGLRTPEDLALISIDNFETLRQHPASLSAMAIPRYEAGHRGVELALQRFQNPSGPYDGATVPLRLVRRHSCGCQPPLPDQYPQIEGAPLPVARLAKLLYGKPGDVPPGDYHDLARDFARLLEEGMDLLQALHELAPRATSYGLDPYYCHALNANLRDEYDALAARQGCPPTREQQITSALSVAATAATSYHTYRAYLASRCQRLLRSVNNPLRAIATPDAVPIALRDCVEMLGGRFFTFCKYGDDAQVTAWQWIRSAGNSLRMASFSAPEIDPAILLPADGQRGSAWAVELHVEDRPYGLFALDLDTPYTSCYGSFCDQLNLVLENLRVQGQLVEARRVAEAANAAKSAFVSNMSHEIRTPMTSILGYAELLSETELVAEQQQYVSSIRRNGSHLLRIISDILDLSKIEAGMLEMEQVECDLGELLADVDSIMRARAQSKQLAWRITAASPIVRKVRTDPTRLRQILLNLVGNAVKFTDAGSVQLNLSQSDGQLHFEVRDTGIGMSSDQVARLFSAFQQADASTTRKFGGTGLGLAISRRLAQLLNGDIRVSSQPGQGTRFTLDLPLEHAGSERLELATELVLQSEGKPARSLAPQLAGRVLLAEDGPDNQALITLLLKRAGVNVTLAADGKQAVDAAWKAREAGRPFDLVLMDVQMPHLDGLAATRHLRKAGYAGPIVALTASATTEDRRQCLDAGCTDFLTKPVAAATLYSALERYLRLLPNTGTCEVT